jgi:uncharacterized protein YuzE
MGFDPVVYDAEADALYVRFSDQAVDKTVGLDDLRMIDYSTDGGVVGIEFIDVSGGIDLHDLPFGRKVEELIHGYGKQFKILV